VLSIEQMRPTVEECAAANDNEWYRAIAITNR
jgi:hypothetical protein